MTDAAVLVAPCEKCGQLHTAPIPMRLPCERCGELHIDVDEFATKRHHTHSCQHCGLTWRPAIICTVGVQFLPGFRNESAVKHESAAKPAAGEHDWVTLRRTVECWRCRWSFPISRDVDPDAEKALAGSCPGDKLRDALVEKFLVAHDGVASGATSRKDAVAIVVALDEYLHGRGVMVLR